MDWTYVAGIGVTIAATYRLVQAAGAYRNRQDAALADSLIDANRAVPRAGMETVDRRALARWGAENAGRHVMAEAALKERGA